MDILRLVKFRINQKYYYYKNATQRKIDAKIYRDNITPEKRKKYYLHQRIARTNLSEKKLDLYDKAKGNWVYIAQYEINPSNIIENKTFNKLDFEYIELMSNRDFPSLKIDKSREIQTKYIKRKYGDEKM